MTSGPPGSWHWVSSHVVLAIHEHQITEHGGADGIRDQGAIESALAQPVHRTACGAPDAFELAAAYLFGLTRNHGFIAGNKRTAWVISRLFLADQGHLLEFDPMDAVQLVKNVAGGQVGESELAEWFRGRVQDRVRGRTAPAQFQGFS